MFVSPVTVWLSVGGVVEESSLGVTPVQGPVSCLSSQPAMPGSSGLAQLRVTCPSPAMAVGAGTCAGAMPMAKVREALSGLMASLSVTV